MSEPTHRPGGEGIQRTEVRRKYGFSKTVDVPTMVYRSQSMTSGFGSGSFNRVWIGFLTTVGAVVSNRFRRSLRFAISSDRSCFEAETEEEVSSSDSWSGFLRFFELRAGEGEMGFGGTKSGDAYLHAEAEVSSSNQA